MQQDNEQGLEKVENLFGASVGHLKQGVQVLRGRKPESRVKESLLGWEGQPLFPGLKRSGAIFPQFIGFIAMH